MGGRGQRETLAALKGNQETEHTRSGHRGAGPALRTHRGGPGWAVLDEENLEKTRIRFYQEHNDWEGNRRENCSWRKRRGGLFLLLPDNPRWLEKNTSERKAEGLDSVDTPHILSKIEVADNLPVWGAMEAEMVPKRENEVSSWPICQLFSMMNFKQKN